MSAILDQHRAAFIADASDSRAFEALEEHYFMAGEWNNLVSIYERRLTAPEFANDSRAAVRLMFRLAQVLEERCQDAGSAIPVYWRVAKLDPQYRPALRQLRVIHANREQWDVVLQIAEMESQIQMAPHETATFQTELGEIWQKRLQDPNEARSCFEKALAASPQHAGALAGLARVFESLDQPQEAASTWQRLADRLRGPDRSPVLVNIGNLMAGPLGNPANACEFYEHALRDDPRNADAVEALCNSTMVLERWPRLAQLYEIRFDLAAGAQRRTAIALEAGRLNLEKLDDTQVARNWFDRARELSGGEDVTIYDALADLERRTGNRAALAGALERVVELAGDASPISALLESADLHSDAGNEERALELLRSARSRAPENPLVIEALSDSLARLGHQAELVEILEQRVALCGDDVAARVEILAEMGRIHQRELDDPEAALACLDQAFQLDPAATDVAETLVQLHRKKEDWRSLESVLTRAVEAGPEPQRAGFFASLGDLRREHFDDAEGAARAYESALALDDRCAAAHQGLEQIALSSGDPEAILRNYEREAEITTDRTRLSALVWSMVPLLEERGRSAEAVAWVDKLLVLQPDDRKGLEILARLRAELGDPDALRDALERLDPLLAGDEQSANRRKLAKLHLDAGRMDDATRCYQDAIKSDPQDLESLRILRDLYAEARDFEALARTLRQLSDQLPDQEAAAYLDELSVLLETQLGDTEGAIVVLWRLVHLPESERPNDINPRLESLLERTGRYEELAQQLLERRRSTPDDSAEAESIDLRRAQLLLDALGQYDEAASLFQVVHRRSPQNEEAIRGLEKALRAGNDTEGLVALLARRADLETDPNQCAAMLLERAILLEESLGEFDEAREALAELAEQNDAPRVAEDAGRRLEKIFARCGDWEALRDRLEEKLARAESGDRLELHESLAHLYRDRLGDSAACIRHFEAAGALAPERATIWHSLAILYEELDRSDDLLRVIQAELDTEPGRQREVVLHGRSARLCLQLAGHERDAGHHYERLLELEPGHPEASEFLIDFYEREERHEDMVELLRSRLATDVGASRANPDQAAAARRISLQLRIAEVQANAIEDHAAAIETLRGAHAEAGPNLSIAAPLADLLQRVGERGELVALCQEAADVCHDRGERASWLLRAGDGLRELEEPQRACEAYRQVLASRPGDQDAQAALRSLYRELGEAAPLCDLLQLEIARRAGPERVALQMERAMLLADELDRPEESLAELQHVLAHDPDHKSAFDKAVAITRELGRTDETVQLIEAGLTRIRDAAERVTLLELSADLNARELDRPEQAIALYREVLALEPGRRETRAKMRELFEAQSRWNEVLDCLFLESSSASPEERVRIFERGVEIAQRELHADAALPWLERLHAEIPDEIEVLSRIANVHRQAGRPEALLRVLEAQLELTREPARQRDLHVDRARILERDLVAPGRALLAWEYARAVAPRDNEILEGLDRLYDALARTQDRVGVIEARILCHEGSPESLAELHHTAASLWSAQLASPDRATPHLLHALDLSANDDALRIPLLRELAENLRASGDRDGWTRAAEAELARLAGRSDADDQGRRYQLHWELADCYSRVLSRSTAAEGHLVTLLDLNTEMSSDPQTAPLCHPNRDTIEEALLDHLRRDRNFVELQRHLEARLQRCDGSAEEWLELARLYDERLHRPARALPAYEKVIERDASSMFAIRGMRHCAELLADWKRVAEALEHEISRVDDRDGLALQRRLADVCWRRLDTHEGLARAVVAYEAALEIDPHDLATLRSLQQVREQQQDYAPAVALYRREIERLASEDPDRSRDVWLRVAEIARDHTGEPERAIEAYQAADAMRSLAADRVREWAELHREHGNDASFVAIFERWCDADDASPSAADQLELAKRLRTLGRSEAALERAQRAIEADTSLADAWEFAADLQEASGLSADAATSLSEAAELKGADAAAANLLRAAGLVELEDCERARTLLRRAADHDPGDARVQAQLTRICEKLENWREAVVAAGTAIDLSSDANTLADSVRMETALSGGRAAWKLDDLESSANFFATVISISPEHVEALEAQGEVLFACGDISSARHVLERRLELEGDNPDLAHHLSIVATGYELEENHEEALARFESALAHDPESDEAHEGIVRIHETTGAIPSAIEVLKGWIDVQQDAAKRASQLFHVAQLELGMDQLESAEDHLSRATDDNPKVAAAWSLLADLLERQERHEDALAVTNDALENISEDDRDQRARLAMIRGRALEAQGDQAGAAEAFATVVANDPSSDDAALNRARLLRTIGDWAGAAESLQAFLSAHPDPERPSLARSHYKLGRLYAGPLERIEDAVAAYERAIALDPEFTKAREPLANLLSYVPDRWRDAVAQHRALLAEDPFRVPSIRGLMQIAQTRGLESAERCGLSILRALGATSPDEFNEAPAHLPLRTAGDAELENPQWEQVRRLAKQTSQEISEALAAAGSTTGEGEAPRAPAFAPYRAFWDTMRGAEAELSVPGFESLETEKISGVLMQVAALALDFEAEDGDPEVARSLDRSIGRWTRRKLRKILDTLDRSDLEAIDWSGWRCDLEFSAARVALDRCDGDLRSALVTLSAEPGSDALEEISETANIVNRSMGSAPARRLLGCVVEAWCSEIEH